MQLLEPHFEHSPLRSNKTSIRLIKVSTYLSGDGLIQCRMFDYDLPSEKDDTPIRPYHCLSYTWGELRSKSQIRINGRLCNVGQNLSEFLHALRRHLLSARKSTRSRHSRKISPKLLERHAIWIDALCINQVDKGEKSEQVQRMGQIYMKAVLVLVWLGNDPRVTAAIEMLYRRDATIGPLGDDYEFFKKLRYWSRAWIVQEIILANTPVVLLESGIYDLSDLSYKMDVNSDGEKISEAVDALVAYSIQYKGRSWPQVIHKNILQVLDELGTKRKCLNHRDQIYSILAISNNIADIAVDYDISTVGLAKHVLRACGESACLCSTLILSHALRLSSVLTFGIELDVPQRQFRPENDKGCQDCNNKVSNASIGEPGAILCLRTLCSRFEGHIYALKGVNKLQHRSSAYSSSALYFTIYEPLRKQTYTKKIKASWTAIDGSQTHDLRFRWRFSIDSLLSIMRFETIVRSRPMKMCYRAVTTRCDSCSLEQQDDDGTAFTWWNNPDVQAGGLSPGTTHRSPTCTPTSSSRYGVALFNSGF